MIITDREEAARYAVIMSEAAWHTTDCPPSAMGASEERLRGSLWPAIELQQTMAGFDAPHETPEADRLHRTARPLGKVVFFPGTEEAARANDGSITKNESTIPPTDMDAAEAKVIIINGELTEDDRVEQLLSLAYRNGTIIESSVPPQLRTSITESPADWYHARSDIIKELLDERRNIAAIYERTDLYQQTPFLRNAALINEVAWNHHQGEIGKRTELAARLIILEAMTAND